MSKLQNVLLFYSKIGGTDRPLNSDINSPFGWDIDSVGNATGPVFSYSINEVEKAFVKVRELTREAIYESGSNGFSNEDKTNLINQILVETGKSTKYSADYSIQGIEDANPSTDSVWAAIFNVLEWVGANQATANGARWANADSDCINTADCALTQSRAEESDVDGSNPYVVSDYVPHSITIYSSSHEGRIAYITFRVRNVDDSNEIVNVTAYFDADAFVERSTNVNYAVYRYEDLNNDSTISNSEFDSQIVNKLFEITKSGKYKTYSSISITKRLSDEVYTQEQFFVFSSLATTLTTATMIEQIKQYLTNTGVGESNLSYTYPDLFGTNTIQIIPVWDNQITTKDAGSQDIYPLSLEKLVSTLRTFNKSVTPGDSGYSPTEVFYIGPGSGWTPSVNVSFILPLLAVEQDTSSGVTNPISARFPDYQPIYGQNTNSDAAEFHFILLKILFHLNNSDNKLTDSFKNSYSVTEANDASGRATVSFTFAGNTWTVYGKANSTATA